MMQVNSRDLQHHKLRFVQINLTHSRSASENLLIFMKQNNIDISFIQEPWIHRGRVKGLNDKEFTLFYKVLNEDSRPRSAILVNKNIKCFLLTDYSDEDTTAIRIEEEKRCLIGVSAYLASDQQLPSFTLTNICSKFKKDLIIGCDANARHSLWGSSSTNVRGESFFNFINDNNLTVQNKGSRPTFYFPSSSKCAGWSSLIDVTLTSNSDTMATYDWTVHEENSFSYHKYITFSLGFERTQLPVFRNLRKTDWDKFKTLAIGKLKAMKGSINKNQDVEFVTNKVNTIMDSCLKLCCKISKPRKNILPDYFTTELKELRREVRSKFNLAYRSGLWDDYRSTLSKYNKLKRKTKNNSWRNFCESIDSTKDTARMRKILSKTTSVPSYIRTPDDRWTESSEETNDILVNTHFPGCLKEPLSTIKEVPIDQEITLDSRKLITIPKILWAIHSFEPYKSAGIDGIIPKMLQVTDYAIAPILRDLFRKCLDLCIIPNAWKQVNVIFIPKVGKINHSTAKDYRPISLSSFVMKVLERILDSHIRGKINVNNISPSQHAYIKGKSTDTALHAIVSEIETSLEHKQYSLAAFMDIEGAFNNVNVDAITDALINLKVETPICKWLNLMLRSRAIHSAIGNSNIKRFAQKGTPQGGVISPLLWLLVVNKVLKIFDNKHIKIIAYADDVVIIVCGLFLSTISERVTQGLTILSKWAREADLGVNPAKTELVLFTRRYKIPSFKLPTLDGVSLQLSPKAKYLGVILDSRLNWRLNTTERISKSQTAYYACRSIIAKTWGLSPSLCLWILKAIVSPILTYGACVWWPVLSSKTTRAILDKVFRNVCMGATGSKRSTPTDALFAITGISSPKSCVTKVAARTAIRLSAFGLWNNKLYGHSNILDMMSISIKGKLDKCNTTLKFDKNFSCKFPKRSLWSEQYITSGYDWSIYTDGSKTSEGCGAGFHVCNTFIAHSFRLANECSIFQCEIFAIIMALKSLTEFANINDKIIICVDSQAAIKALDSPQISSSLLLECREELDKAALVYNITITWVPSHSDFYGNEIADTLARCGAEMHISRVTETPIPISFYYNLVESEAKNYDSRRWNKSDNNARAIWHTLDFKWSTRLINFKRSLLRKYIFALTGHWNIGKHARIMGITEGNLCPGCGCDGKEVTFSHFWCSCPALDRSRLVNMGQCSFTCIEDLTRVSLEDKIKFIKNNLNWFDISNEDV